MATKKPSDEEFESKLRKLRQACGDGYDTRGLAESEYQAIPTGHDDLDCLLTRGASGIYLGGIIEIMGSEGSGKTSLALRAVRNAQRLGYPCCWIDAEAGFSPDFAKINGVDPEKLIIPKLVKQDDKKDDMHLMNAGEVLELAFQSIKSDVFGLVVLDSVAGLSAERVLKENYDPNSFGISERARAMAEILPKIAHICEQTQTSLLLINQLRDQPGAYYQNPYHTPGGRTMRHLAQQRISVEKINGKDGKIMIPDEDGNEELFGHWARVNIVKNKKAPPVPTGIPIHIPIYYREYDPDNAKKCYDLARKLKVVTINKGILTWKSGNETLWKEEGESSILGFIRDNELESRLAHECVRAAAADRNQNLKNPVKVSQSVFDLAKTYNLENETKKKSKPKKEADDAL